MTGPARIVLLIAVAATVLSGCDDQPKASACPDSSAAVQPVAADIERVAVVPDRLFVSKDGTEIVANCWQGTCHWSAGGDLTSVDDGSFLAISPDGNLTATGGRGATVDVADARDASANETYQGLHDQRSTDASAISDVEFSADGRRLAGADTSGTAVIWNLGEGCPGATIELGNDGAANLSFSPDGALVAITSTTVGGSGTVIRDAATGDEVATLEDSTPSAAPPVWSPDGRWLAAAGAQGSATLWATDDWAPGESIASGQVRHLAFSPDSRMLALTSHDDHDVQVWSPRALGGGGSQRRFAGHSDDPVAVAFAPDGATLYSVTGKEGVFAWSVRDASVTTRFEVPPM